MKIEWTLSFHTQKKPVIASAGNDADAHFFKTNSELCQKEQRLTQLPTVKPSRNWDS